MSEGMADLEIVVVSAAPLNGETPLERQDGLRTAVARHYIRNHFPVPDAHPGVLEIGGRVLRPLALTLADLRARPAETWLVTLECAGNGRRYLDPAVPGEQWSLGAVGTAEWTGTRLGPLLDEVGVESDAVEALFEGADRGTPAGLGREIAFGRSLPIEWARDTLLAWAMNGDPLPPEHGAPLRLVVPGRYGMASVKWLHRISLIAEPFRGFFQADRYVIDGETLGPIAPRALITSPADGGAVAAGAPVTIGGFAWSGAGPVTAVDLSADGGSTWWSADLGPAPSPVAWRAFASSWTPDPSAAGGWVDLLARASDAAGATQPLEQNWNSLGYMNNAARPVRVRVIGGG